MRTLTALIFGLFICQAIADVGSSDMEIISHPSAPSDALTVNHVRAIFALQVQHWPDGRPILVFVFPENSPRHQQFSKQFLGIHPYQLRKRWDRIVFAGRGVAPHEVSTLDEMLRSIASTPGAIGYVDHPTTIAMPVQTIRIDVGQESWQHIEPGAGATPVQRIRIDD